MVVEKGASARAISRPLKKCRKSSGMSEASNNSCMINFFAFIFLLLSSLLDDEERASSPELLVIDVDTDIDSVSKATVETDEQELGMSSGLSPFQFSHFNCRLPPENVAFTCLWLFQGQG
jgi:hypothetical protein